MIQLSITVSNTSDIQGKKDFDEVFDEKKMLKNIELNKIADNELILSIFVQVSNCKIVVNIVKGCKPKEYPDGNTASHWEKLNCF
jgi:hypothetical protein